MNQPYMKWGLIAGGASILYMLILYIIDPNLIKTMSLGLIPIVVLVFCMTQAAKEEKEALGGYMSWGQALKPTFLVGLIYIVMSLLFDYIMTTMIDPALVDIKIEQALEIQQDLMTALGQEMTEEQIETAKIGASPSLIGFLTGIIGGLICMVFPISAIASLILQKKDPNEDLV